MTKIQDGGIIAVDGIEEQPTLGPQPETVPSVIREAGEPRIRLPYQAYLSTAKKKEALPRLLG